MAGAPRRWRQPEKPADTAPVASVPLSSTVGLHEKKPVTSLFLVWITQLMRSFQLNCVWGTTLSQWRCVSSVKPIQTLAGLSLMFGIR